MDDKKRFWHKLSAVAAPVLVAVFLVGGGCALSEIRGLRQEVGRLKNDLNDRISALDGNFSRQIVDINSSLDQGERPFTNVKTHVDSQGGQLRLTVSATPKTLTEQDVVTLVLGETSAVLESKDGSVFSGSIPLPPAEELTPILVLTSGATRRQELMDTIYPKILLSVGCGSEWVDTSLNVWVYSSGNFTVSALMGGEFSLEIVDAGARKVATLPLSLKNDNESVYASADLSEILAVPGSYQIYLKAELGGLSYTCTDPFASFSSDATGGSGGMSGENQLDPIFK